MKGNLLLALALAAAGCKQQPPPPPQAAANAPAAPALPASLTPEQSAHAAQAARENCLMCHSQEMLDQQRLTPQQWAATVKKMQGWGAPVEAEMAPLLAAHLAQNASLTAGPYAFTEISPAQAEESIAPTRDGEYAGGDEARGAQIFRTSCAECHGQDGRGAKVGINLVDRPILYRAEEFAAVVKKGRNKMPETVKVTKADIAALLAYLRSLPGV